MLEEFMALAKVPETAQQCAKIFMELVDKWQTHAKETEQKEPLETALMTGREKAEKTIGNAVIAEAAERSINRHVYSMQGEIFPDEYRNAVVTEILRGNSAALYLKTDVEESVRQWFRELENALNEHYSAERLDVLRHEIQSRMRMDAIQRDLEEVLDLLRPKQNLNMSNQDYKDIFEMPLFMHTGNSQVCLQNLFVPQRFTVKSGFDSNESMNEYLARFVRDEKARFLFIEGDAGCGKSSLTAYLSWHYEQHDQIAKDIFGNVQLMMVRLRNIDDLPKNGRPEQRLKRGVLEFLYGQQERNAALEKRFRESGDRVLFLDGYDELCTIEGIENSDAALNRLNELDCKIIVTTRPNYIRYQHFGKGYWHIALEHFDGAQRREWLARYADCGETLGEVNRAYLERIGDNKTAGICDTPMGLYMVAAGHFTPDMLENEWSVYRQIFHNELSETNYNPDSSEAHSIWEYQELLGTMQK